jgi:hypothetical protein
MALSRAQKKLVTARRAQRRLDHALANIDWELDVLQAEVKELAALEATDNVVVELEEGLSEDQDH